MAKRIRRGKSAVIRYEALKERLLAIAQAKHSVLSVLIPVDVGIYWRLGQTLAWYAEDLLEELALDLRRAGNPWQAQDLAKMARLYLRYPTIERLSSRCMGRAQSMNLDEFLEG